MTDPTQGEYPTHCPRSMQREIDRLRVLLADAWYSFEPAYNAADPEAGMDTADWWALMDETRTALKPEEALDAKEANDER